MAKILKVWTLDSSTKVANIDRPIEAWPMLTNGVAAATIFTVTDISS
uniref:OSJNBb0018J12.4 protein n=1 Tax=Oryza sativa subsp. japonica TaxID=39947 RepID=Q7XM55_ORYSJ|nr:OSJNBb0018J12.4 [Oryza sativa Japonica Group]